MSCEHIHKDYEGICEDCGKLWNSEYHISDVCVGDLQEDADEKM